MNRMIRALLILLLTTTLAMGADTFEQKLAKRELAFPDRPAGLPQVLAALSDAYQAQYREPLRIFIAVDVAQPPAAAPQPPKTPPTDRVAPPPAALEGPAGARTSVTVRAPVIELLRLCASLSNTTFTIQGDLILFHSPAPDGLKER